MFSGIGGFELALDENFECAGYSEIDTDANAIYKQHFPTHNNYGDARKIKYETVPDFEFFFAGFPCPEFSIANKNRKGLESTGSGSLFFEIIRCLETKRPSYFILENVRGLLNHGKGKTFLRILTELWKSGYDVQHILLDAQYFGLAQQRKRILLVGNLRGKCQPNLHSIEKWGKGNDGAKPDAGIRSKCVLANRTQQSFSNQNYIANTITPVESNIRKGNRSKSHNYIAYCIGTEERGTGQLWNNTYIARADFNGKGTASGISEGMDKTRSRLIGNAVPPVLIKEILKCFR